MKRTLSLDTCIKYFNFNLVKHKLKQGKDKYRNKTIEKNKDDNNYNQEFLESERDSIYENKNTSNQFETIENITSSINENIKRKRTSSIQLNFDKQNLASSDMYIENKEDIFGKIYNKNVYNNLDIKEKSELLMR